MKSMCRIALALAVLSMFAMSAYADMFTFSNLTGSQVVFVGDSTFHFGSLGVHDSSITSTDPAFAALLGYQQDIAGDFTLGTITTVAPGVKSAPVTGSGTWTIYSLSDSVTGTITWTNIVQVGTGNDLNTVGSLNLQFNPYLGGDPGLLLVSNLLASAVASASFTPAVSLTVLKDGPGPNSTAFSGQVSSVPDGGTTLILLGSSLFGLATLRRKFRM